VLGEWDGFFGSLLTSLEDKDQSLATIRALLLAQTESGLIPNGVTGAGNFADRSQPPVGAYCVWKVLQRYPDDEMLKWAYPRSRSGTSGGSKIAVTDSRGAMATGMDCWSGAATGDRAYRAVAAAS